AGRLSPKRFCSLVYEKRELLMLNRELIKLEDDVVFEIEKNRAVEMEQLKSIMSELEMNKSWEEAIRRDERD
ncbi:MAG: flap endonuclease, partial [Opitutae bacterium]|nr:flap endonuclease [Opitutae bacterium]